MIYFRCTLPAGVRGKIYYSRRITVLLGRGDAMNSELRDRIMETAIELFNKNGYNTVSIRDISKVLHISPGNLTYYFPKKEDLLKAIVQMQYEDHLKNDFSDKMSIRGLNNQIQKIIQHQKRYYYYFYSITEMSRVYPEFAELQRKIKNERYEQFRMVFYNLAEAKIMKPEGKEGLYDNLAYAVLSILMYWIQQSSLDNSSISSRKDIFSVIWSIIVPNLTAKGMRSFQELNIR